jgi:hypothetical protein
MFNSPLIGDFALSDEQTAFEARQARVSRSTCPVTDCDLSCRQLLSIFSCVG